MRGGGDWDGWCCCDEHWRYMGDDFRWVFGISSLFLLLVVLLLFSLFEED
jgi:hypothetical protein